jgi:hypothetical protein
MKTKVASRSGKDRYGVRVVRRLFVIPIFGGQDGIAEIREVRHGGWECVELCYECETEVSGIEWYSRSNRNGEQLGWEFEDKMEGVD